MVMRDIGSYHCPEPRFISRGIVPIQYIYDRLFAFVELFMNI